MVFIFIFLYILPGRTIFEFVDTPQQNQVTQIELFKTVMQLYA